jgi:hypothetical protein
MRQDPPLVLSPVEAARRLYNTPSPTAEQVGRVVKKIEAGTLARSERGGITTTLQAVADYLARRETHRQQGGRPAAGKSEPVGSPSQSKHSVARHQGDDGESFSHMYRNLLKDYFLAVLLRRKATHRSQAFQWAVLGSQGMMLAAAIALAAIVSIGAIRATILPPEHRAIHEWVSGRHDDVKITNIAPLTQPPGGYRVEYNYLVPGKKRIHTRMILTLKDHQVVNFTSEL